MKTKVEVLGYEIEIEEVDGVVTVKAELDGETVEEFTLEAPEEGQGQDEESDDDVKGFKDFDGQGEEEDFGDEESEGEESEEESEEEEGKTLESFQSFFNKR
jgi:hypothetical protein